MRGMRKKESKEGRNWGEKGKHGGWKIKEEEDRNWDRMRNNWWRRSKESRVKEGHWENEERRK